MSLKPCKPTIFEDKRGRLGVIDDRQLPFKIKRVFWIYDVPYGAVRGQHSHRDCQQAIICLAGEFDLNLDDLRYHLKSGSMHIIQTNVNIILMNFSSDAVCLVLCSEYYNEDEVING